MLQNSGEAVWFVAGGFKLPSGPPQAVKRKQMVAVWLQLRESLGMLVTVLTP